MHSLLSLTYVPSSYLIFSSFKIHPLHLPTTVQAIPHLFPAVISLVLVLPPSSIFFTQLPDWSYWTTTRSCNDLLRTLQWLIYLILWWLLLCVNLTGSQDARHLVKQHSTQMLHTPQHCCWLWNSSHNTWSFGPVLMDFTDLVMFPGHYPIKQLAWQQGGMAFWRLSHSASQVAVSCKARAKFSRSLHIFWIHT